MSHLKIAQQLPSDSFVLTRFGRSWSFTDPRPEQVDIRDIAWNLAGESRWNSMAKFVLSVAQHSVKVSQLVPPEQALSALLHDAAEAYLGDLIRPIKHKITDLWEEMEAKVNNAVSLALNVDMTYTKEISHADDMALKHEAMVLINVDWSHPTWERLAHLPVINERISRLEREEAYLLFLGRYYELTACRPM